MPRLVLATRNAHKTAEIAAMLAGVFDVADLRDAPGAPEIEEVGATFAENAALKANGISRFTGGWALADDSGLEVDALGGEPGVRSARFAGGRATDAENNRLLLSRLSALPGAPRTARFRCALALARDGALVATFDGTVEGRLIEAPRGAGGFGYDPLFIADGYDRTFAELSAEAKNAISHRARALAGFRAWLAANPLDTA
ncbi:MAG: RdgB/HAM1 family non-canonical purine NTP pyrophosphatase [Terrimicrobiaceae bacterium]|nr:RdgB/HAM1 family non-canonical purine NTP pyrophosphatase [Terrimicrobiaceae bacterium]